MINDFGEKIGGTRKDVWKERGLMVEDLDGMTQGEKEKYVKKDCVWPKEDMKSLVADGMPRFVVYFRNEVRKWVHPQPKEQVSAKAYIEGVRKIKGLAESIKEESGIPVFVDRMTSMILFKSGRYYDYVDGLQRDHQRPEHPELRTQHKTATVKSQNVQGTIRNDGRGDHGP